jgi:hypothetical protein
MQDMDCVGKSRNVDHPESSARITESDFPNASSNRLHWLPVDRIAPGLHPIQFLAGLLAHLRREIAQTVKRTPWNVTGLSSMDGLYHN